MPSKHFLRLILQYAVWLLLFVISSCNKPSFNDSDRSRNFNEGWKFVRDSLTDAGTGDKPFPYEADFDDSNWKLTDLPHDWSVEALPGGDHEDKIGPFYRKSVGGTSTGYVIGGSGWYRKEFTLSRKDAGKSVFIYFDGVYMESTLWVNGKKAGEHYYGYTPFYYDITPLLKEPGKKNLIAVKVNNTGRNSRWYSGSGIYRNVTLIVTDPIHIPVWGVHVKTPKISIDSAVAEFEVSVQNNTKEEVEALVKIDISDYAFVNAGTFENKITIPGKGKTSFTTSIGINQPLLWSPSSPSLYTATVTVKNKGRITDQYIQVFGIRKTEFSAEKGFLLNGKPVELKGACMHHDNGLLGAAAFDRAEERRVRIMKANGFNAIRTSHNPPSEAFLNACDRQGMLIIDETFDMWEKPKNPQDYHRFFRNNWQQDVKSMVMRDRNHPSVIIWSIGNEIPERADTNGIRIGKELIAYLKLFDTSRPFTNAICEFWDIPGVPWDSTAGAFKILTIGGYNYQFLRYESDHEKYPERIMMGTESVPKDAFGNWEQVIKQPYVIGDFVWTGMDYLGETGIGHTQYLSAGEKDQFAMPWPWFNAWCGDIDITGGKKPQMLYKDVLWGNSKLEMNVHAPVIKNKQETVSYWGWPDEYPHWNWMGHENEKLQVAVYSKGRRVKLILNGREIGIKEIGEGSKYSAFFEVPYEPGELKAIAYDEKGVIAEKVLKTSGNADRINLLPDRPSVQCNRNELCFIEIQITDEFGVSVTDYGKILKIEVTGNGEMVGSGNACPYDMNSFGRNEIKTWQGKALIIVRPFSKKGPVTVSVESGQLPKAAVTIQVN